MNGTCLCPSATVITPYSWLAVNAGAKARGVFVLVHQYKAPLGKPIGINGTVYNYAVCTMNACSLFISRNGPLTTYLSFALFFSAWLTSTRQCCDIFLKLLLGQTTKQSICKKSVRAYKATPTCIVRIEVVAYFVRVSNSMQNDCFFHLVCKAAWIFNLQSVPVSRGPWYYRFLRYSTWLSVALFLHNYMTLLGLTSGINF